MQFIETAMDLSQNVLAFYRGIETLNDVIAVYSGPWYWVKCEQGRELVEARKYAAAGIVAYVPTDVRQAKRSRHSSGRLSFDTALIPRLIFARPGWLGEIATKFTLGSAIERDNDGNPRMIPDHQLQAFRAKVEEWHSEAQKRAKAGKKVMGKGKYVKMEREALAALLASMLAPADEERAA